MNRSVIWFLVINCLTTGGMVRAQDKTAAPASAPQPIRSPYVQKAKTAADAIKIAQEYVLADYAKGVHRTLRYHGKPEDLLDWSKPYVSSQIMTAPMGENCYQGLFWSVHFRPHERLVTPFNTAIFPAENVTDADDPYMPNEYQINVSEIGDAVFVTLAVD